MIGDKFFLSQQDFVQLPISQRNKLREVFDIKKSGQTKVRSTPQGDKLESDGTEPSDLMNALNTKALLTFLGEDFKDKMKYDFDALFVNVMKKIFPTEYVEEVITPVVPVEPEKAPEPEVKVEVKEGDKKITVGQKKGKKK